MSDHPSQRFEAPDLPWLISSLERPPTRRRAAPPASGVNHKKTGHSKMEWPERSEKPWYQP